MPTLFTSGKIRTDRQAYQVLGQGYEATTGEVFRAGFGEGFEGAGSAIQDVASAEVSRELDRQDEIGVIQKFSELLDTVTPGSMRERTREVAGQRITEEDWKVSPYFREGLSYQENLTTLAAEIQARRFDRQQDRQFIFEQAEQGVVSGGAAIAGGLAGSIADAKNVAVSVAVAAATPLVVGGLSTAGPVGGGVGAATAGAAGLGVGLLRAAPRALSTITRINSLGIQTLRASRKARLAAVVGEGVVSSVPSITSGLQNADILQEQYDAGDATLDFFASVGLSVGIHKAGEALGAAWKRYSTPDAMTEVAQLALRQIENGERLDVQPIVKAHLANVAPSRIDVAQPTIRKLDDGRWEASFGDKSTDIFVGRTREETVSAGREVVVSRSLEVARQAGYRPEAVAEIEDLLRAKLSLEPESLRAEATQAAPSVIKARGELELAEQALANAPKSKVKLAEKMVAGARQRLETATAKADSQAKVLIEQNRLTFERKMMELDEQIRSIQRKEAGSALPQYTQKQLDDSVEARAAKSIDPQAPEIVADIVPDAKVNLDEELALDLEAFNQVRDNPAFAGALQEAEMLDSAPKAVLDYVKCKFGR